MLRAIMDFSARDLINRKGLNGPFGSPVFACCRNFNLPLLSFSVYGGVGPTRTGVWVFFILT